MMTCSRRLWQRRRSFTTTSFAISGFRGPCLRGSGLSKGTVHTAGTKRNKNSVIAPQSPGHFVPKDTPIPVSALGLAFDPGWVTLYVEALDHSASVAAEAIKVELDPDGHGPVHPEPPLGEDTVRSTFIRLEFVIPNAYDEASGLPAPNAAAVPTEFVGVSDPRPTVTLDEVSSSQVVIKNGMATVELRGVVRDPIADNVPRGKVSAGKADIDSVTISVDGQPYDPNGPGGTQAFTIPVAASDEPTRKGFWCQHPNKGTFGPVTVAALGCPWVPDTHKGKRSNNMWQCPVMLDNQSGTVYSSVYG